MRFDGERHRKNTARRYLKNFSTAEGASVLNLVRVERMNDLFSEQVSFDDFWTLYPRREAKKDALKAWAQIDSQLYMEVIIAAAEWRRVWQAQQRGTHMIKMPATWLRGECWTDDIPPEFSATRDSHIAAKLPEAGERTAMPAHVRELLAKLRAK